MLSPYFSLERSLDLKGNYPSLFVRTFFDEDMNLSKNLNFDQLKRELGLYAIEVPIEEIKQNIENKEFLSNFNVKPTFKAPECLYVEFLYCVDEIARSFIWFIILLSIF